MKSVIFWALAALNVLLLAALIAPYTKDNTAHAARARRPDFIMIPGRVIGQNSSVVYVIDTANQRLGAVALSNNGKEVAGMAPVSLQRLFEDAPAGGANERDPKGGARRPAR